VAVGDDKHDDSLARDARLARLLKVAGGEAPPAPLDAVILAAAKRAVYVQPQASDTGGRGFQPRVQAKRNWYAPLSIAAVLLVSVGLVTLVYREKGDELVQSAADVSAPTAAKAPDSKYAAVEAPRIQRPGPLTQAERRNPAPAQPEMAKDQAATRPPESNTALSEADSTRTGQAPSDKAEVMAQSGFDAVLGQADLPRKGRAPSEEAELMARSGSNAARSDADSASKGQANGQAPTDKADVMVQSAEAPPKSLKPIPKSIEPALPARKDSATSSSRARARDENAGATARDAPASAASSAAAASDAVGPSDSAATLELGVATVQGRSAASPQPAGKPAPQSADARPLPRPLWLARLDHQPPDKWLAQLAAFRRDARASDSETLLVEFRRRFPDHPASAR
jgi:resuscitation-promoting factor RpfA